MTPCEKLGYKVGDEFLAGEGGAAGFDPGEKIILIEDDGTDRPLFCHHQRKSFDQYCYLNSVSKITPSITLQPGDHIATKDLTEDDYHAVARAFRAAGADENEYDKGDIMPDCWDLFGWDEDDGLAHWDSPNSFEGSPRQLTLSQILGATNAGGDKSEESGTQDGDGWIENTGTCPVEKGTRIDVRYRDGVENIGVTALEGIHTGSHKTRTAFCWGLFDANTAITHYRRRQEIDTKMETTTGTTTEEQHMPQQHLADQLEAALLALEQAQSEVDRLQAEYRAAYPRIHGEVVPAEDMYDPENWRAGDVLMAVDHGGDISKEGEYVIVDIDRDGDPFVKDDAGDITPNYAHLFRFVRRP
ncbi:hypothetical protein [Herbaspirillum sp.]|jgi:hypothetical protein|uniref:hypothetical protein n=1 Tax=Herbaspirillum sp. TaxID=1890675 RepID=UPI000C09BF46|nr:hypothetical protein [Herbaspirillum sp.]MAF06143.1 hypothetical protein [Herbaspirillum sp.]|tara:strand:+ start:7076 stop:8149 length:1074 start_codon:yes stop_codon:yes gene_type:complete